MERGTNTRAVLKLIFESPTVNGQSFKSNRTTSSFVISPRQPFHLSTTAIFPTVSQLPTSNSYKSLIRFPGGCLFRQSQIHFCPDCCFPCPRRSTDHSSFKSCTLVLPPVDHARFRPTLSRSIAVAAVPPPSPISFLLSPSSAPDINHG